MASFDDACSLVQDALAGQMRKEIVAELSRSGDSGRALHRLRECLRSNVLKAGRRDIDLDELVRHYDGRTRQDGFHALHDWDGKADRVHPHTIPIDVLNYLIDQRDAGRRFERVDTVLAIVLDYYFFYILALLSLRVWDEGDANANLDCLTALLRDLQGASGSGQRFADNAETLILIATSHYEPEERGYRELLERARTLDRRHRTSVGLVHAASMGGHLRFGFEATYGRDIVYMRDDNVADYPWLCFALATVMREYARMHDEGVEGAERERMVEAVLNALSPDARAFVGKPPASLSAYEADRSEFFELFHGYRQDLLAELERHRPSERAYSPLSFFFNFAQNVLKGTVVDALLRGEPWKLTFNDLLTGVPRDDPNAELKTTLAKTLMAYARSSPDTIRGRLMPVIVYDPQSGREAFSVTMRKIKE